MYDFYCAVHRSEPIVINGEPGFLVWDYLLINEITFESSRTGKKRSLFKSASDSETESKFNEYLRKYS